ncbi:hypothetical protein SXCC_00308 [Gluconacetobacter sp. SXCC-1]|nr:hypothetical protein SXCC_00308 [Gluconacetobacter sp. SXCC-1]
MAGNVEKAGLAAGPADGAGHGLPLRIVTLAQGGNVDNRNVMGHGTAPIYLRTGTKPLQVQNA